jgi:hypothetical protein
MRFKVTWSAWLSFFFFVAATSFDATVDRARAKERERAAAHLGHNTITISAAASNGVPWEFFPAVLWNPKRIGRSASLF